MCDEQTELENEAWLAEQKKSGNHLSRRDFAVMAGASALAMALPLPANAAEVVTSNVLIETADGTADCFFAHPAQGKAPGFLMWTDIKGLRPAFELMGKRLAQSGHAVLVPNPYYRSAKAPVVSEGEQFGDPAVRERILPMARSLSPETIATDTRAFADFLEASDAVDTSTSWGVSGYCMGGSMAFHSAATVPAHFGHVASFHGGRLVTDEPTSPHRIIQNTKADYLIAIAANDHEREPETKGILEQAFAETGHRAEVEVYEGAMHGWCPPDGTVYNEAQAERAWARLLALLENG